jgi:HEAT repeat protein
LARALAFSRDPATFSDLLHLMQDSHSNVVCQSYYALGQRGQQTAIKAIEAQMVQSDHWYTQWYGYRAMRRLGWHQIQLKSVP